MALSDRLFGQSLKTIHRDPTQQWTVAALANEAGMSHTTTTIRHSPFAKHPPTELLLNNKGVVLCALPDPFNPTLLSLTIPHPHKASRWLS